jgi:hypothetical protein
MSGTAPSWVYRAVAYEIGDTFRQPVWMCSHDHSSSMDAEACGAAWLRYQGDFQSAEA